MQREEMIRCLTEATLESALSDPGLTWLRGMLAHGFAGYGNMPDAALTRELQLRGLIEFDDPEEDEDYDDDEDAHDDDDEQETLLIPYGVVRSGNDEMRH